ncbi:unnamed protein product, partial [Lampetra planeri]
MVDSMVDYVVDYVVDSVYVSLTCAFRYGRDDMEVIGIPVPARHPRDPPAALPAVPGPRPPPRPPRPLPPAPCRNASCTSWAARPTPSASACPRTCPCSVTMQPAPCDKGKSCGVDFEVKAFCCEKLDEDIKKKHSVSLLIRKVQFAPEKPGVIPSGVANVDSEVTMNASLDKE